MQEREHLIVVGLILILVEAHGGQQDRAVLVPLHCGFRLHSFVVIDGIDVGKKILCEGRSGIRDALLFLLNLILEVVTSYSIVGNQLNIKQPIGHNLTVSI